MPSSYKVIFTQKMYSVVCLNVAHFVPRTGAQNTVEDLAFDLLNEWVLRFKAGQPNTVQWLFMDITPQGDGPAAPTNFLIGTQGNGSGSDQFVTSLAYCFLKRTLQPGPANRGRLFLPGFNFSHMVNGVIGAPGFTFWQPQLNALNSRYAIAGTGPYELVVKHPEGFTPVNQLVLSTGVGHMRSRKPGIGT